MKKFTEWLFKPTNLVPIYLTMVLLVIIPIFIYFLFNKEKRQEMWKKVMED